MTKRDAARPRRKLQLVEGARINLAAEGEGAVTVSWQTWTLSLGAPTPALLEALRSLPDGVDEEEAASEVREREGMQALARWSWLAQTLLDAGALRRTLLTAEGDLMATFSVRAPRAAARFTPTHSSEPIQLSRFACIRAVGGTAVLDTPLGAARIELHDPRLALATAALARPATVDQLSIATGLGLETARAFVGLLREAGALAVPGETDLGGEASSLALWEVPDAVFHVQSRLGRREPVAYGATYRFRGRIEPAPAIAPVRGRIVSLAAPDLAECGARDRSFTAVLESRRSWRSFSAAPVEVATLSEFLYRSARNTRAPTTPSSGGAEEMARVTRPYPAAGGCHPLEVYVVAHHCAGLDRGLYRYDPAGHGLAPIAADPARLDQLLVGARDAAEVADKPPVLIIFGARFARMFWKYEGIGYANLLKEAGGLLQTMCLVATAMGLAACPIGGGDAECFSAAAGTAFWEESSVAEFMLGHAAGGSS
jgi:SagB-type dehydrogenase family enzyme